MRISVTPGDPGYLSGLGATGVRVTLDDQPVKFCFTADEERGLVVVADLDAQGRHQLNHKRDGVLSKTLRGRVRIDAPPGSWLAHSLGHK